MNGAIYFAANDGTHGNELWKSDGTPGGTVMVKDINPGTLGSNPTSLTVVGSTLFFAATDGVHGPELWKSDGTAAGTVMVKDVYPGRVGSYPKNLTNVNGTLFYQAFDPQRRIRAVPQRRDVGRHLHGQGHLSRLYRFVPRQPDGRGIHALLRRQ